MDMVATVPPLFPDDCEIGASMADGIGNARPLIVAQRLRKHAHGLGSNRDESSLSNNQ